MPKDLPGNGCSLWADCLTCPYPQCRYDGTDSSGRLGRNYVIHKLASEGWSVPRLARKFQVAPRSIYRILAQTEP